MTSTKEKLMQHLKNQALRKKEESNRSCGLVKNDAHYTIAGHPITWDAGNVRRQCAHVCSCGGRWSVPDGRPTCDHLSTLAATMEAGRNRYQQSAEYQAWHDADRSQRDANLRTVTGKGLA